MPKNESLKKILVLGSGAIKIGEAGEFDFENQMKLEYTGDEDEILKKIELGNVSLPLSGSLISGTQSLFGIKMQLQFGKATFTTVFSEQKSETSTIRVDGGAQTTNFEIFADDYEV